MKITLKCLIAVGWLVGFFSALLFGAWLACLMIFVGSKATYPGLIAYIPWWVTLPLSFLLLLGMTKQMREAKESAIDLFEVIMGHLDPEKAKESRGEEYHSTNWHE
jgi:uncharacterized membrane protein